MILYEVFVYFYHYATSYFIPEKDIEFFKSLEKDPSPEKFPHMWELLQSYGLLYPDMVTHIITKNDNKELKKVWSMLW